MKRVTLIAGLALTLAVLAIAMTALNPAAVQAQGRDCYVEYATPIVFGVDPETGETRGYDRIVEVLPDECERIQDGRVNDEDAAAEAAIYCQPYGIDVYDLGISGEGDLALRVTWAEIDDVPVNPEENTLIAGVPGFGLYRLTNGQLQLNGPVDWEGKPYVYIWDGCRIQGE